MYIYNQVLSNDIPQSPTVQKFLGQYLFIFILFIFLSKCSSFQLSICQRILRKKIYHSFYKIISSTSKTLIIRNVS